MHRTIRGFLFALVGVPALSHATSFSVIENVSGLDYFQTAAVHTSPDADAPMVGSIIDLLTASDAASGSYDDATGDFSFTFADAGGGFTLSGSNLLFTDTVPGTDVHVQSSVPTAVLTLNQTYSIDGETYVAGTSYNLDFAPRIECCQELAFFPNTLTNTPDGTSVIALWGAGANPASGQRIGVDIAVRISNIPLPAAGWMFISGILGLAAAYRRRQRMRSVPLREAAS